MEIIKNYFEKQLKQKQETKFNIFSALHNENDEMRLHSRFIAYLLSSDANHGMGNQFLKLFVQSVLKIDGFDCANCEVQTEYKDIDILIYNNEQAIIIENKIYAGDQDRQLERYYNAIKHEVNQLNGDIKRKNVFIAYLTLDGRSPSNESMGDLLKASDIIRCDYPCHINTWLENCIILSESENELLSKTLYQYSELLIKLTSNLNQAKKNQMMISKNIDKAWVLQEKEQFFTEKCKDIFKHVKWHTVADFINELGAFLEKNGAEIKEKPDLDAINKVTHNENNNSTTKIVIRFCYQNNDLYIANDKKNGFTLGKINGNPEMWRWDYFSKDIKFSDFSTKQTFDLINDEKRGGLIKNIVDEILNGRFNKLEKNIKNI